MIRVLQIVDTIKYDSGISSFLMNVYRNIDRKKIQFDFLVAVKNEESYESEIIKMGGRVFYFGNPYSIKTVYTANHTAKRFISKYANQYSAFHLHTSTMAFCTLRHIKHFNGKCRIVHSHSSMTSPSRIKSMINHCLNLLVPLYANKFVACSSEAADFLYGHDTKIRKNAILIWNGVDEKKYIIDPINRNRLRNEYNIRNEVVLLHVSNFSKIKNTEFLANVLTKCIKLKKSIRAVIVGDGPEQLKMKEILTQNGVISSCFFTGKILNVSDYFNMADLFLLPSIKEGMPVTAVEAQACGLPCILSDTITKECSVGNVTFLPLIIDEWVNNITSFVPLEEQERINNKDSFCKSELTMKHLIQEIENLYGGLS